MKKGVRFGRPKLEKPSQFTSIAQAYQKGKISIREGARQLDIPKSTLHNWLKDENYCPKEQDFLDTPTHKVYILISDERDF